MLVYYHSVEFLFRTGSVAERSKALVLGTSLFGGVGSNPTAATGFELLRLTLMLDVNFLELNVANLVSFCSSSQNQNVIAETCTVCFCSLSERIYMLSFIVINQKPEQSLAVSL